MKSAPTKTPAVIASAVLIAILSGCGGGDGANSDYCRDLSASAATFAAFRSPSSPEDVFKTARESHRLAAEAPNRVKEAWKVLDAGMTTIEDGFRDAGLTEANSAEYTSGKIPEGVNVEKLQGLPAKVQRLDGPEFDKAAKAITQHAKDVCKVTFES